MFYRKIFPFNPLSLFDDDDYNEDGLYDWILTKIKDLPVCKTIYEEGHEAGYKNGFISASENYSIIISKLKEECKKSLNELRRIRNDKNDQINVLITELEKLENQDLNDIETQVKEKIEFEQRKVVKTEKDIRTINTGVFSDVLPSAVIRSAGSLILDILIDIFRKGKEEGKERGKKDAKKLFRTKLLKILDSFNKKADKLREKINELQELKMDIQKEIIKICKTL